MHLLDQIHTWARTQPNLVAHISDGRSVTYAELADGTAACARLIWRELRDDRSPVVVLGHKEPEMLMGFLGSVTAGHPYVPLDRVLPAQRIQQIIAACGSRLLLTPERIREALGGDSESVPVDVRVGTHDAFYIMFTSGSTGEPKGVTITLENLSSFLDWMHSEHSFEPGCERFLNQAPFSFDLSVMDTYLGLSSGGTVFSLSSGDLAAPARLFEALSNSGITTWVSTPSFVMLCLAEPNFGASMLPKLRRFLFCGETLPKSVAARLLERFPAASVWNTYGPTEATVATTSVRLDAAMLVRYSTVPVGAPRPGSKILISAGEIVIVGPNVSPGYFHQPELTRSHFFDVDGARAYRTGDLGHLEDGLLFFDGRVDNQLKLHGYRIELGDVEANLRKLPSVQDAVVLPLDDNGRVTALAAFVLGDRPTSETEFQAAIRLRSQLAEWLPVYMIPRVLRIVDRWPLTPNGKVDRRALASRLT